MLVFSSGIEPCVFWAMNIVSIFESGPRPNIFVIFTVFTPCSQQLIFTNLVDHEYNY